jgi:hypothetical protein
MPDVPSETILSETSVQAGVQAMERIHGRHLADMAPDEQADARAHWRQQVEEILHASHDAVAGPPPEDRGSAVIVFVDGEGDQIDVSVRFAPELRDLGNDQVEGTAAQILALTALAAVEEHTESDQQ